jgi:hypothetical protein
VRVVVNAVISDHRLIVFCYDEKEDESKEDWERKRFNVRKADWNAFRQRLAERLFNGRSSWLEDMHCRADYLTSALTEVYRKSMPMIKPHGLKMPT